MINTISTKSSIGIDPNTVSHITEYNLLSAIDKGNEKLLILFCWFYKGHILYKTKYYLKHFFYYFVTNSIF